MNEKIISADILNKYQLPDVEEVNRLLTEEAESSCLKIVVLDDDPTGVQTVHDVSVYTDWSVESMKEGFAEKNKLFFQIFEGTVLKRQGGSTRETFTVRKNSNGVGVEKTWPLHSPHVVKVEVIRRGKVRRAKLNYLRDRVGKAAKVKELVK